VSPAVRTPAWRSALTAAVMPAALAIAAMTVTGTTAAAAAVAGRHSTPGGKPVTQTLGTAAQSGARSFWTRARMEAATPAGPAIQAGGSASPGVSPAAQATPTEPPGVPDPVTGNGVPTVGALFFTTFGVQVLHFCTASVVDSTAGDVVLTAAHCVYDGGPVGDLAYVPEWHAGTSPYGAWTVSSITVAAGWKQSQNPADDYAFLTVTPPSGTKKIQQVTGGLKLAVNAGYAHPIHVIGYNALSVLAIECSTKSFEFEAGQMEFYCNSFYDGVSGSPWITGFNPANGTGTVIGNVGGYEQGGDESWASYSDYYTSAVQQLFTQAQAQHA
jgi:V8-like Glu-specific endopeptidase